jgi:hypothetical protein
MQAEGLFYRAVCWRGKPKRYVLRMMSHYSLRYSGTIVGSKAEVEQKLKANGQSSHQLSHHERNNPITPFNLNLDCTARTTKQSHRGDQEQAQAPTSASRSFSFCLF